MLTRKIVNRMSVMLAIVAITICSTALLAQYPNFQWTIRAGGTDYDYGNGIARDGANNIFVTGRFYGAATFGSTTLNSAGLSDVFVAKYNDSGNLLWVKRAGGTANDYGQKVAIDKSGDVIVVGYFSESATFGSITLNSSGGTDIFIAKYDGSSGNVSWAKRAGGTGYDYGYDIETDHQDNILVTGSFNGSATFDYATLNSAGSSDVFLAKYNNSGNLIWVRQGGGNDYDYGNSVEPDRDDNIFITGRFNGSATFGSFTLTSSGSSDIFIVKYNSSGNVLWARRAGGSGVDYGNGVSTDATNSVIITGYFSGSATFGSINLNSSGSYDIFVAKYDASGNVQWAKKAGGSNSDQAHSITTDKFNNNIITGNFYSSATFGSTTLYSAGGYDVFVAKYDDAGNLLWAKQAGGSSSDYGYGITSDLSSNIILTGYFQSTANFGSTTISSAGGSDIFIAKIGEDITNYIEVTFPNGGEQLYVGFTYNITWLADNYVGTVEIALSKNGGASWVNLTSVYPPNTGSYTFAPTSDHVSENCLIKVTSIENAFASDQSNSIFSIKGGKKSYLAAHIPSGVPEPTIDGYLNDSAWSYAQEPELLATGGNPNDFSIPWSNFSNNQVTWKAVWSSVTNKLYVAVQIQDDVAGIIDNDYDTMWEDDCVELYTDGDRSGGDYSNNYAIAQQWQIRRDNARHLAFLPGAYTGSAINSRVSHGANGNWILEVEMTIYNHYPSIIKQLTSNDIIGWDVWYNDSDNKKYENGAWVREIQVGWGYSGPAYYDANYFHELKLGPSPSSWIKVMVPNGGEIWNENTSYELQWTSQNTSGSVTIFYSTDGGATWKTIYNSTPDDGSASWITPTVSADITTCRIKVQDVNNSNIWDMSDNNFTIKDIPETITVIQPNGGEKWPIESTQTIQWSSSGVSSNVKIDLTRDGGASWEVLYVSTANDGSENWKVTGPPSNMCKIRITDFDGIPSDQTDGYFEITPQSPPHFTPVWTGNPFQPMTIYCTRALLYGDALVAGDEIAVFDGTKCVGTKVLTQTPTQQNPVEIICSRDDGTGNGFIEGNPILFKVWDQSGVTEYNARPQFIDLQTGAPISPIPFAGLGTAAVQLTAPGLVTQSIPLYAGWNIFSLAVTPEGDQDLLKILTPILPVLVKVIDEEGRSIVKLFGNWVNSIGNWQATEGYHINVSQNVTLQVTGMEISTPMPIPLKAGWNIMSYPCLSVSRDAKSVLQSLIDSNYLVKVINEQGQSLVKIFGNWNNSIGSMNPGEGYLINVNTNCTLTMSCSGTLFTSAATAQPIEPRHFRFDKTGNPFEPMNIFIVDARIDGQPLTMGDEIAVFDGDQLVAVSLLPSAVSITNPLEIIASKDDGSGKGFLDGHAMRYQVWRSSTGETVPINGFQVQFFDPNNGDLIAAQPFEAYGTAVAAINFTTTSVAEQQITPQSYALHQNHPNPFNPTTRISYELPEATDVQLVIYDIRGNVVKQLISGRQYAGHYEIEWDGRNNQGFQVVSGIYLLKIKTEKYSTIKKMTLTK